MVNHALCACDMLGLTPLTDESIHHEILQFKFNRMRISSVVKKILEDYRFIQNIKTDLAAIDVIRDTLPALTKAEMSDVLEFREANKDSLVRFRTEMGKLAAQIEGDFWDDDFRQKIIDVVDLSVKPSIQAVRDSVVSVKDRFVRILRKGAQMSPVPIVATVAPGCIPAIALAVSVGIVALDEYLESLGDAQERRKNGISYLFEAQRRFPSTP